MTTLLVLTTLFISTSNGLPKTAYIKMVDVWLLCCMAVPFLQVLLQTAIDYLRAELEDEERTKKGDEVRTKVAVRMGSR